MTINQFSILNNHHQFRELLPLALPLRRSAFGAEVLQGTDRKDDVVLLFVKFENQLHCRELVRHTEIDRCGRTDKIHRFGAGSYPRGDILEIEAGLFVLKKYSHTIRQCTAACAYGLTRSGNRHLYVVPHAQNSPDALP